MLVPFDERSLFFTAQRQFVEHKKVDNTEIVSSCQIIPSFNLSFEWEQGKRFLTFVLSYHFTIGIMCIKI